MIGFFFKKAFFDGWDNLFSLILVNIVYVALAGLGFVLPQSLGAPAWLGIALLVATLLAMSVWWSATVFAFKAVADFGSVKFPDMWEAMKAGFFPGIQVGSIAAATWILLSVGLPFYLAQGGILSALAGGILFWCALVLALALQYYLPLRARLGGGLRKNLRKSFILFFDNPLFSVFLLLYCLGGLGISVFLAFLMPGFAGTALALDVAIRLRLYKYDWLEAHPEANRRAIPWDELLIEDRELVGKRTLKGMIFPWKE